MPIFKRWRDEEPEHFRIGALLRAELGADWRDVRERWRRHGGPGLEFAWLQVHIGSLTGPGPTVAESPWKQIGGGRAGADAPWLHPREEQARRNALAQRLFPDHDPYRHDEEWVGGGGR